jgi:hypothetical protein
MKTLLICAFSALLILPSASAAQQLGQPHPTASVRQDLSERADATPKVASDTGITPVRVEQPLSIQPDPPTRPVRVLDARGREIPGAVQLGPNRVLDPRDGRIHMTMPVGDGQRIIEFPKKADPPG